MVKYRGTGIKAMRSFRKPNGLNEKGTEDENTLCVS